MGDLINFVSDNQSMEQLQEWGTTIKLHDEPHVVGQGCYFVSGFIPCITSWKWVFRVTFWIGRRLERGLAGGHERYVAVKLK
jgi:hypothetical protein